MKEVSAICFGTILSIPFLLAVIQNFDHRLKLRLEIPAIKVILVYSRLKGKIVFGVIEKKWYAAHMCKPGFDNKMQTN